MSWKGEAWTVCWFKGGLGKKEGGGGFLRGCWYPNAHYGQNGPGLHFTGNNGKTIVASFLSAILQIKLCHRIRTIMVLGLDTIYMNLVSKCYQEFRRYPAQSIHRWKLYLICDENFKNNIICSTCGKFHELLIHLLTNQAVPLKSSQGNLQIRQCCLFWRIFQIKWKNCCLIWRMRAKLSYSITKTFLQSSNM